MFISPGVISQRTKVCSEKKSESREFPGGLVVKTPCFHCRTAADMGSLPGRVTKILHASRHGHKQSKSKKKMILPLLLGQELAPNRRESNSLHWSVTSSAPVLRTLTIKRAVTSGPALPPKQRSKAGWRHLGPGPAFQCNPPLAHSLPQSALTDYLVKEMPCVSWNSLLTTFLIWLTHFSNLKPVITGNSLVVLRWGLCSVTTGGTGSIPGQGTEIPQGSRLGQLISHNQTVRNKKK